MRIVRAEDLQEGDTIKIGWRNERPSVTKVKLTIDGVWTEWSDGLNIELPRDQELEVLDEND